MCILNTLGTFGVFYVDLAIVLIGMLVHILGEPWIVPLNPNVTVTGPGNIEGYQKFALYDPKICADSAVAVRLA